MKTEIHPKLIDLPLVQEADAILRKCVHCGFCTATCPTYQLLGDELDGPRGRIYLIKNLLEDNDIDDGSVQHLDRCLTCRSCETTCPSGVEYGRLLDIGKQFAAERSSAPMMRRVVSSLLRFVVPRKVLFKPLLAFGQLFRPLMPRFLKDHVPAKQSIRHSVTATPDARVLLLSGCVQSSATPNVVASLQRIIESTGGASDLVNEGCCGALDYHLAAHDKGIARMRQVIDLLYPRLDEIDTIVSSATGCGVTIAEYPDILKYDADYAEKAKAVAEKLKDPVELLESLELDLSSKNVAVHTPCSMQHGLDLNGRMETLLQKWGFTIEGHKEGHLCCGSAGTYSILQPELSTSLRDRKVKNLGAGNPSVIVTANVGCQLHLQSGTETPVMHWLELVADLLD
ncbi:MAG: glycolate oxidase subunit GlcF [Pseudomonadales bacterium]|nr:glycolate oxidase subunit GlcF [Pseudomonadales bacterium]